MGAMGRIGFPLALLAGIVIGYFDSRPGWDDTPITAVAVFLSALVCTVLQPRAALFVAFAVGVPVVVFNFVAQGTFTSLIAVGVAVLGCGAGALIAKARI